MLTDTEIKKVKADGKARKLFDAHGLFLFVIQGTDGDTHKRWRCKFTCHKKEKLFSLSAARHYVNRSQLPKPRFSESRFGQSVRRQIFKPAIG